MTQKELVRQSQRQQELCDKIESLESQLQRIEERVREHRERAESHYASKDVEKWMYALVAGIISTLTYIVIEITI